MPDCFCKVIFLIAPILTLFLSFLSYTVLPFSAFNVFADINVGVLYIFDISSFPNGTRFTKKFRSPLWIKPLFIDFELFVTINFLLLRVTHE